MVIGWARDFRPRRRAIFDRVRPRRGHPVRRSLDLFRNGFCYIPVHQWTLILPARRQSTCGVRAHTCEDVCLSIVEAGKILMTSSTFSPSTYADLVDLGRRLYEQALVRREQELITDPRGQPIGWLLDTRIPMLDSRMFREVGHVLSDRLRAKGVHQVAGYGFGSYSMVCAVLSTSGMPSFKGGFVREQRKPHGRRRLVEGPLTRSKPIVLLDDILNSGRSAGRALSLLRNDGFEVVGVMTLFNFTWSGGRSRVEAENVWVDSLLDLNLRDGTQSSSDSL